jgi:HEPN domain-containing protein
MLCGRVESLPDPGPEQGPTPEQREYAALLLERAKSDLGALRVLMADEDMLDDVVGFHAQQAAEKALKVVLVMADIDFPRSHDLRELADMAVDNGVAVPESIQEARWLTPWAAQLRYEMLEPLDRDAALSVAADAVEWARALTVEPEEEKSS